MKYMGSKAKYFNDIFSAISNTIDITKYKYWIEPFVGGANFIDKVNGFIRIGNDYNKHLIYMFKCLQNGWIPPNNISEEEYNKLKELSKTNINNPLIGFAGFCCSFGAKFFGGYARGKNSKGESRNYAAESCRYLLKQQPFIKNIEFYSVDYKNLTIPENSIVYCDPPYANTTKYKIDFDHNEFWKYCNDLSLKQNIVVFVSEYTAPDDWKCIWQKEVFSSIRRNAKEKKIEKLFYKGEQ